MVAVKAGDVDRALRDRKIDRHPVLLIYGPDHGLVSERAKAAAHAVVDDPANPFQLLRLHGDMLAAEPGRLADEAGTIGLFGGRRSLWVRSSGRNIVPALTACLDLDLRDTSITIEAGDLARSAPLRALCEKSPRALSLPCYSDGVKGLSGLLDTMLQQHGLSIGSAERAYLLQNLGADRLASRGEIEKLMTYVHGRPSITADDVEAVVSDVAGHAADAIIDAAFSGRSIEVTEGLHRHPRSAAAQLLAVALRHALSLMAARSEIDRGQTVDDAVGRWRGLHFGRHNLVKRQLDLWRADRLQGAIGQLQSAVLETRRQSALANSITGLALLDVAQQAKRSGGRRHPQASA